MTDRRDERWLVTSGKTRLPVRTRSIEDAVVEVEIVHDNSTRTLAATIVACSGDTCVVSIEGRSTVVRLAPHEGGCHAMAGGEAFTVTSAAEESEGARDRDVSKTTAPAGCADLDALCAPMPATVSAILVEPGSVVETGDALVRLEAMKMELAVHAPAAGRVKAVDCRVGDLAQPGRPLVALEPQPMPSADDVDDA